MRDLLEALILSGEIETTVASLSNNKSLGLDGLPNELYDKYGDVLLPKLLDVFQEFTNLIHPDQTGFIPQRSTSINIRRLYFNLLLAFDNPGLEVLGPLDAAKSFDRLLWTVLHNMGFGPNYVSWIKPLAAIIRANQGVKGCRERSFGR